MVRASTVRLGMLAPESARRHGIERSSTRGVLRVTVMKNGKTVPAAIEAVAHHLTGRPQALQLEFRDRMWGEGDLPDRR